MSQLPEKYKGVTPGPWTFTEERHDLIAIRRTDRSFACCVVNGPNASAYADECEQKKAIEQKANAHLIADAPMLACRVAELEELLSDIASITISDMNRWGSEATIEKIVRAAHQALAASPFGLAADPQNDNQPAADTRQAG